MKNALQIPKIGLVETWRMLFVAGIIAIIIIQFQSLTLPFRNGLLCVYPDGKVTQVRKNNYPVEITSPKSAMVGRSSFLENITVIDPSVTHGILKNSDASKMGYGTANDNETEGKTGGIEIDYSGQEDAFELDEDMNLDEELPSNESLDLDMGFKLERFRDPKNDNEVDVKAGGLDNDSSLEKHGGLDDAFKLDKDTNPQNGLKLEKSGQEHKLSPERFAKSLTLNNESSSPVIEEAHAGFLMSKTSRSVTSSILPEVMLPPVVSSTYASFLRTSNVTSNISINSATSSMPTFHKQATEIPSKGYTSTELQNAPATSNSNRTMIPVRKKMRCMMPPRSVTTISEMNRLLLYSRASPRSMRPRWSSARDKELVSAKRQILNAPAVKNERELHAPLFQNISMFKRSYELMERMLKVYVYKEGEKPIFHQPELKGIYASEGWFMKLMEGNKQFVVRNPRKAHLFYMPFSSRMLQYALYVRNSHSRRNLAEYLKIYAELIAAKYPFFNRTGGTDHFLAGCHDWAPYETRHHMERCIKALCNSDVTGGFKIGRDVSLPQTYVRSSRNPLRDVGGKPPSERPTLAFFAGNMHGYLRPILLKHWQNKDPDMKIFGPMPRDVASKMNYIQHMKSSKYCICPKGYGVNSPRVVEAIFYECVPVIISDNFVPPFFEVLDWNAFSIIIPEKYIPNLKEILLSIPEKNYTEMQMNVKKVQKHFLWHSKPVKYDLFHMTLHSVWFNRVFQLKTR